VAGQQGVVPVASFENKGQRYATAGYIAPVRTGKNGRVFGTK
jgi:hypothetical protein